MDDRAVSRVYYVDWLRILAVLLLFPYHTLRVFNHDDFYVKSSILSSTADWVINFIDVWHMPLLFFLAGCSTYFALHKRSAGRYSWERVKRLLVPLVFGIFVLVPPQTWYGARFNSGYSESFWHYLSSGDFLEWNVQHDGDYYGGFGIGQLWFILWLLVISMVLLPLMIWTVRGRASAKFQALSRRLSHPAWWLAPIVLLTLAEAAPKLVGKPTLLYAAVFFLGALVVAGPKYTKWAERLRYPAFAAGVGLTVFWVESTSYRDSLPDPSWGRAGLSILGAAAVWLMIIGAMGLGKRYLDRTSRTERYLAEGSYPVYIIHQTVIVILAFYVVDFAVPEAAQWVVLLILAVLGTFALYEIVRRVGVLRFLMGMKQKKKPRQAVGPASRATTAPEGSVEG